jgi:hypothetical protein
MENGIFRFKFSINKEKDFVDIFGGMKFSLSKGYFSKLKTRNYKMAEREGFEPSEHLLGAHTISNRAPSASRASLRRGKPGTAGVSPVLKGARGAPLLIYKIHPHFSRQDFESRRLH